MHVLVLGANGLLGSNVLMECLARNDVVVGTYHTEPPEIDVACRKLDITNKKETIALLEEITPDVAINCAAMTDVDGCEAAPERAMEVNGTAPGAIASACAERDIEFIHVSTDYVFDGVDGTPYEQSANPNPVQVYGETKLAGERAVREHHSNPIIARLSFVYGIHRGNDELTGFPAWVRSKIDSREEVPLFTDQTVTPTRAGQAATTLRDLCQERHAGTYHIACRSCISPYEFGAQICERMDASVDLLAEGKLADVDRPARRPADTCLAVDAVEDALGRPQPTLSADLDSIIT